MISPVKPGSPEAFVSFDFGRSIQRAAALSSVGMIDRTQALPSQWPGRAHEPDPQRSRGQTLLLPNPRSTATPPHRLRRSLQLRPKAQDPQRTYSWQFLLEKLLQSRRIVMLGVARTV